MGSLDVTDLDDPLMATNLMNWPTASPHVSRVRGDLFSARRCQNQDPMSRSNPPKLSTVSAIHPCRKSRALGALCSRNSPRGTVLSHHR